MGQIKSATEPFSVSSRNYEVVYPSDRIVSPDKDTRFVYVMRMDSYPICDFLADKLSSEYHIPKEEIAQTLDNLYEDFVHGLSNILGQNFQHKGKTKIHLFKSEQIEFRQLSTLGNRFAISLDPLIFGDNIATLGLSRCYLPGGTTEIGLTSRPSFPSLKDQIFKIKSSCANDPIVDILEDDIFTGGSLIRIVDMLEAEGITVKRIIPGIQIGNPQKILDKGIEIIPSVQYKLYEDQDLDLGDPRDFLLGADGLVTFFGHEKMGRLPYIYPFVSPTARLSIPENQEIAFSQAVLELNKKFFADVQENLGIEIRLDHMNEVSTFALKTLMPEIKTSRMIDVVDHILKFSPEIKRDCSAQRNFAAIQSLHLPKKIVFLDVNGTILPSDSNDGFINAKHLADFQNKVRSLESHGMAVGLNSDSPLPQLREFADKIGLKNCPIIAENGAIISFNERLMDFRKLHHLDKLKDAIVDFAEKSGIERAPDAISPEFGGQYIHKDKWAFGANRTASVSVFGPPSFLQGVRNIVDNMYEKGTSSYDFSPEYNFMGIHSGPDFRKGKGSTLKLMTDCGHTITSIGDSLSDFAPISLPSRVFFVGGNIPADILVQPHVEVAREKEFPGVIECLHKLSYISKHSMDLKTRHEPEYPHNP